MKAVSGKRYTARELAAQFGCDERTVQRHGNKLFGVAQNGVAREFDEAQVTAILESVKAAHEGGERAKNTSTTSCRGSLNQDLANVETELTPILRQAQLYEIIRKANEELVTIKDMEIARLAEERDEAIEEANHADNHFNWLNQTYHQPSLDRWKQRDVRLPYKDD
ncbi:MAG: hypothetical protein LBS86_00780 [Treponema sp.]|jgi:hypothetical protein|nr:hypothetical protein [Treponema sp.]